VFTTWPPTCRKALFIARAIGVLRGWPCGSLPVRGGRFVVGGVGEPLSQWTIAEPAKGKDAIAGMPHGVEVEYGERPASR
jgi:hypothetical protein